ncbi:hypothetical protein B0T20DRAFT_401586 [Sordaria brevicollis]|uniref:Secreted protein n=1 Tax=Sordaria brevicollis TaxID=83679 RepID=A0AAE0PJY3_SORBR|nr:hypothetical protein B0T20DRAFT_401586 [Sordaria brevicollis]
MPSMNWVLSSSSSLCLFLLLRGFCSSSSTSSSSEGVEGIEGIEGVFGRAGGGRRGVLVSDWKSKEISMPSMISVRPVLLGGGCGGRGNPRAWPGVLVVGRGGGTAAGMAAAAACC